MMTQQYSRAMSVQRDGGYSRISAQKYEGGGGGFGGSLSGGSSLSFRQGGSGFTLGGGGGGNYAQSIASNYAMNSGGGSLAGVGYGRSVSSFGVGQGGGFAGGQGGGFGVGQGGGGAGYGGGQVVSFASGQAAGFGGALGGGFRSGPVTGGRIVPMQGGSLGAGPRDGYDTGFQGPVGGGGVFFGGPGTGFPGDFGGPEGLFPGNEKQTMQNLNDRLSSYLEKVRALETANADLEIKIRDWYAKQITSGTISPDHDHNKFFETINDLRSKIKSPSVDNARMVLQIDNARLAADDFRLKYENELYFRQSIEADISGLKRVLEEQNMSRAELEVQIETMTEELTYLKTNHEEELQALQGQAAGQVNVEIDAAPGVALTKRLKDMRTDYEALTERNRMEAEQWFIQKSMELKREMTKGVEEVQTTTTEVSEQRRLAQSVETEMQSQLAMKKSIEDSLIETENRYGVQLMQIQLIISTTEEQLGQVRGDMERQRSEYQQLLDIKVRLEMEIETYRRLLDEEGGGVSIENSQESSAGEASMSSSLSVSESMSASQSGSVSLEESQSKFSSGVVSFGGSQSKSYSAGVAQAKSSGGALVMDASQSSSSSSEAMVMEVGQSMSMSANSSMEVSKSSSGMSSSQARFSSGGTSQSGSQSQSRYSSGMASMSGGSQSRSASSSMEAKRGGRAFW